MNYVKYLLASLATLCAASASAQEPQRSVTPVSDKWALTDALGRKARTHAQAGPRREDKFVGIFYWTWHQGYDWDGGEENPNTEVKNITKVLKEYPEAINSYNHPAWGVGEKRPSVFHWGEPLFGFYKTTDPWVLRKHAEMLADAGVDVVFFDCTNGSILWEHSAVQLLAAWIKAKQDGVNVPKIAYLLPFAGTADAATSLRNLYDRYYSFEPYKDLWFYWEGKPLIMAHPNCLGTTGKDAEIREFFTFRPGQPDYVNGWPRGTQQWGWLERAPIHGYNPDADGHAEQCAVGVAQNARDASGGHCCAFNLPGTYGRSYSRAKGHDPRHDGYLYGANFQEQWDQAIDTHDPKFIFVTGWNEWTSGMWNSSHGWSDPLSFVDQFDWDHSRDCEPTKDWGDKGDVYYQQLVDNIRRFKGMSAPDSVSPPKTVTLGDASSWADVLPRYVAYRGNTMHRNHRGRFNMSYTDNSGRNDITGAQVAHDEDNIYFHVETAANLTPASDPNWMMLFIDIDRDKSTGWAGYDYVVNRRSPTSDEVIVEKCIGKSWIWLRSGTAKYKVNGNALDIAIPKSLLKVSGTPDFEFKWSDNMQKPGDVMDFYVSGDAAPGGRFNYVYTGVEPTATLIAPEYSQENGLKVAVLGDKSLEISSSAPYFICNVFGATVKSGCGPATVTLPSAGVYIVASQGKSVKVIVK